MKIKITENMFNKKIQNTIKIFFLIIYLNIIIVLASYSGVYIDNGIDRTIMHRMLDDTDKREVEKEILQFLGLPDRPKFRLHGHGHISMKKSAPQFLLDAYHRLNEEDNPIIRTKRSIEQNDENFITDLDKRAIDQSDIIMTFLNKNHHVAEVRHEHGRRLWFDVSEVTKDNLLMMAELRIYQNPTLGKWLGKNKEFIITVYSIVNTDKDYEDNDNDDHDDINRNINDHDDDHDHDEYNNEKELEILSSINTTSEYHGWLELNVTEGLSKWLLWPKENKGLYIGAHAKERPDREIKLEDIGIINVKGDDEYQPFMVGFFKGPEVIKQQQSKKTARRKRNVSKRRNKSEKSNPLTDNHRSSDFGRTSKSCQIQTLYINFKDLRWHDWIIAPEGYSAFYCSGECSFPLNAHMNATNHAIVQTLVHLINPSKVPKPCCAPTTLGTLPVLYHLNEANVNLKKYKNMVVKSCGCH